MINEEFKKTHKLEALAEKYAVEQQHKKDLV